MRPQIRKTYYITTIPRIFPRIPTGNQFVKQTHYFYYNQANIPIVLEDSNRLSHQITNIILKILLESAAGYPKVTIKHCYTYDHQNITALLDRISGKTVSKHCQPPELNPQGDVPDTMINIEAWMFAGFNKAPWVDTKQLVDAGPLGPQGRMGWFLPKYFVERMWRKKKLVVDHYRALKMKNLTSKLSLWYDEELEKIEPGFRLRAVKSRKCNGERLECATLLAMYNDENTGILEEQINKLGLFVDIVWLGEKLSSFVLSRVEAKKPVLFFNWTPNDLIAKGNYIRINFPETHAEHKDAPVDCDFPVNQLTKVMWDPIKTGAPEAYHIISKMTFSDLEYDQLLKRKVPFSPEEVACKWVQENQERWGRWLPDSLKEKPKIYLGGLFPLTGKGWAERGLVEGAQLALKLVNKDSSVLPNYELEMIVNDTQCKHDMAIVQFIAMQRLQPAIAGILGPGCSDPAERIASLSQHFHLLMVSYGAQADAMSDRIKFPYFFRTMPPTHLYRQVYPALFDKLGWQVVGTLTEIGHNLPEYHMDLLDQLALGNDQLNSDHTGQSLVVKRKVLNTTGTVDVTKVLREFKEQNVRVIIADVVSSAARQIMCEAFKQKMTGFEGYVWFLPSWYPDHWQDVEYYNSEPSLYEALSLSPHSSLLAKENVPCTTAQVERAAEGHFVLSRSMLSVPDTRVAGGITVEQFQKMYTQQCADQHVEESKYASFVYDAVWVFALGLDKIMRDDNASLETLGTAANARAMQAAVSNLSFSGTSGWIRFDQGTSDRLTDLTIHQVFHNETRLVGRYTPRISSYNGEPGGDMTEGKPLLQLDTAKIRWLSPVGAILGDVEYDREVCYIENIRASLNVSCTVASIIVISLAFLVTLISVIGILLLIKYRCDMKMKKLQATHERMKELGLLSEEYSHLLCVDDWEIPLENIVLNRELGEGAFGAVMGGEMFKEKEGWVAVAVKTLKVQHTVEEKLDFFSEVDLMKRLQHKNIVQLLGVCTRKQPMYAVMEFLLHGDLKTYLLARRSLVGQGVKEAEDTKAENLTQMAVDVAMGLSYLHSLKYIHRDLASRNCLVHANKTVKIADFGLTRHVSSTDYYRFSRKGMLPVRWTAPEALRDGIYSAKSDIWSYGVLVFEIVTFGSFPYQGLSNRQVMEEVLRGTQLKLPLQCNDALRSFIRWCMSAKPDYRPDLSDILSYLAYSPAFLTPCIDAPITSVVHEDTDSMGNDSTRVPRSLPFCTTRHSVASMPPSVSLDVTSNTFEVGGGALVRDGLGGNDVFSCSTPNSSLASTPLTNRHKSENPAPAVPSADTSGTSRVLGAGESVCSGSIGFSSTPRRHKHYSRGCQSVSEGASSWIWWDTTSTRLKDRKKTFSMPGIFVSTLGRVGGKPSSNTKMVAARRKSVASPAYSPASSFCSDKAVRPSSVCGLNYYAVNKGNTSKLEHNHRHSANMDDSQESKIISRRNHNTNIIGANSITRTPMFSNGHVGLGNEYKKNMKQICQTVTSL